MLAFIPSDVFKLLEKYDALLKLHGSFKFRQLTANIIVFSLTFS